MELTKITLELQQNVLNLQIELAKLREMCNNLREEVDKLSEKGIGTGVFLDGVPEIYRKEIEKELNGEKR
jgi:50S ribosomal subunit-associated GTPase HflX